MRKLKRKFLIMCSIAMICMSSVCFTACSAQYVAWSIVDVLTFGTISFAIDNVEEGETKDRVNQIIDGIAGAVEGVNGVWEWITSVVAP